VGDGPSENVGEILLIHASLYVLAEKLGIDRLKRQTLFKIHKTLSLFSLDTAKLEHIIHFVQYGYSNERTADLENTIDGLRELDCQYIAANAEFKSRDSACLALIGERGRASCTGPVEACKTKSKQAEIRMNEFDVILLTEPYRFTADGRDSTVDNYNIDRFLVSIYARMAEYTPTAIISPAS
jgi:hypothetical protein